VSARHTWLLQRVLESLARLRLAFPADRPNKDIEEWKAQHDGKDPFGECVCHADVTRQFMLLLSWRVQLSAEYATRLVPAQQSIC
jgi:hypothetical protein